MLSCQNQKRGIRLCPVPSNLAKRSSIVRSLALCYTNINMNRIVKYDDISLPFIGCDILPSPVIKYISGQAPKRRELR